MNKLNIERRTLIVFSLVTLLVAGYSHFSNVISEAVAVSLNSFIASDSNETADPFAINPDGNEFAQFDELGESIELMDLQTSQIRLTLYGQTGAMMKGLVFSPDGQTLAAIDDNAITLWDVANEEGQAISILPTIGISPLNKLVVGPAGKNVAAIGQDAVITLWNTDTSTVKRIITDLQEINNDIAISPDGLVMASASTSTGEQAKITFWDTLGNQRSVIPALDGIVEYTDLVYSPNGETLAAISDDSQITLFDSTSEEVKNVLVSSQQSLGKHAFSPDGEVLARGSTNGQIELWNVLTGELNTTLINISDVSISKIVFSHDGKYLAAVGTDFQISIWDLATNQVKQVLTGHNDFVADLAFSLSQAERLTSVGNNGEIIVWDITTGWQDTAFQVPLPISNVLAGLDPASSQLTESQNLESVTLANETGGGGGQATIDEPIVPENPIQPEEDIDSDGRLGIVGLAISPDGTNYACTESDGTVQLLDAESKQRIVAFQGHNGTSVTGVVFSSDGKKIITVGRDTEVRTWYAQGASTGRLDQTLLAHEHPVRGVAASPDDRYFASVGEETRVMLWEKETGILSKILTRGHTAFVNAVTFSADGTNLATGGNDGRTVIWNIAQGKPVKTLFGHFGNVNAVAFSADGQLMASGSSDGRVIFWDISSGQQIKSYVGHQGPVRSIAFHPDSKSFVSTGDDRKILVLDTSNYQLVNQISVPAGINAMQFDRSGKLVVGDQNSQISVWDTNLGIRVDGVPVAQSSVVEGMDENLFAQTFNSEEMVASNAIQIDQMATQQTASYGLSEVMGKVLDWMIPAAHAALPGAGPGGPILIVTANCPTCGAYNDYYAEILLNEGLNNFSVADLLTVTPAILATYDIVILGNTPLTGAQATIFSDWVNTGGNLIAMRPDPQLAGLLGLTDTNIDLTEGYLLVDTSQSPGNGIVNQTMQFHGTADRYTLNGAASLATLYTNVNTATANPALTLNNVGTGQAAAFTYDLATSIVYTRQGNPAWEAQERDALPPIRSDDKFFGNLASDPQPDWVDLVNKVAIPQADEQQRWLANLILQMNLAKTPLPRFWYFPRGAKAVVIMTGDDHVGGGLGTEGRFEQLLAASDPGCSVADWECLRGTSYMFNGLPGFNALTNAQAIAYTAQGFEVGLHVNSQNSASDYTPVTLEADYTSQINIFVQDYPGIPAPATMRHHAIVWSDWTTGAEVQLNHGIRLDTNYYFWPPGWVVNRPGYFNGTAMAMRFAKLDGSLVDVYQATSQMTDESGQIYPFTIDTLLDYALGSEGYYGAYVINAHTDVGVITESTTTINSAKARGVPIISSVQLLTWLDGRNASSFGGITWDGNTNTLQFDVVANVDANGLQAMIPANTAGGTVATITNGSGPVTFAIDIIKGLPYAVFSATTGAYTVNYGADNVPPTVTLTDPANAAIDVVPQTAITATFSEPIDPSTVTISSFELRDDNSILVPATVGYDAGTRTATLTPIALLDQFVVYTATITVDVTDLSNNAIVTPHVFSFTTGDGLNCPCSVFDNSVIPINTVSTDPGPIEVGVKFQSDVTGYISGIRFYQENLGTYTVNLWDAAGLQLASGNYSVVTPGWQEVNISPVAITANTTYVASYFAVAGGYAFDSLGFATAGIENTPIRLLADGVDGGNGLFGYNATSFFPTGSFNSTNYYVDVVYVTTVPPDSTAPTVTAQSPASGTTEIVLGSLVTATFNEGMDPQTINVSNFELRDGSSNLVAGNVTYDAVSSVATFTPTNPLAELTTYTATVTTGVSDIAGNALVSPSVWSFATGTGPTCPCSVWDDSTIPTNPSFNDPSTIELGVKFTADVDGYITGVRFYQANLGAYIANLWDNNGLNMATVNYTATVPGWQQVELPGPVAITANTVYVVSYYAANGNYAVDQFFFTSSGLDNPPIRLLQDGVSGGNGVFIVSPTSAFPTSTFGASNYWVDPVFEEDITPLEVTAQTPLPGETGVLTNTPLTITFNKDLNPATVNATTIELRDTGNVLVPSTISYDEPTKTVTLIPSAPLLENGTYTAKVKGGATDPRVKDLSGIALVSDINWSFTTPAGCLASTSSIWPSNPIPTIIADPDTASIEVGVKFSSSVDGIVCGLRFYKASTNLGVHIGTLWSDTGQNLSSVTFANETASGWQKMNFATPIVITADTVYTASYLAPQGQYSLNGNYFTASGITSGPLHALSHLESGGNGLFQYGTGGLPTDTFNSSNYWVDVIFAANSAPDTIPPTVTSVSPVDTSTGIIITTQLSAVFSEAVDPASVNNLTFELKDNVNAPVSGVIGLSFNTVTFTPDVDLVENILYTATLKGGAGNIRDLAGNILAADFIWSFTTGGSPCAPGGNPIVCENSFPGNPPSEWDVNGAGDPSIQGFATDISVNIGQAVEFKIDTSSDDYRLDIYRMGYYGGDGARKVATVEPTAVLPQIQSACLTDTTGLFDCGNWAVSASWSVPVDAMSGIYFAKAVREDSGNAGLASHIVFVVRDDAGTSDLLFQTSDTTWQAYNAYGGNSLYNGSGPGSGQSGTGRAYKVSYNRPFINRSSVDGDWVFNAEYPMVRWLEANGYDVSYFTGVDSDRFGSLIANHKMFLSVGHDEYWSAAQRTNVEAARDAGVHLAFFSGNSVFWKNRWENSIDGSGTENRTLVSYKETHEGGKIDPLPGVWTGTWRDDRFGPHDGGRPENELIGQIFGVNGERNDSITVPESDGKLRFWRNTSVATLSTGTVATMPAGTLGYEWDVLDINTGFVLDNQVRPAGLLPLSSTTVNDVDLLIDLGSTFEPASATHKLTQYRAASGALVFGAGTVQWSWGLDSNHDRSGTPTSLDMQQATVNLIADMGVQAGSLQVGLLAATASTDTIAPISTIVLPAPGATVAAGVNVLITGTASDTGGGKVGGVEVSVDGGVTWEFANGRNNWSYDWSTPNADTAVTIMSRAVDDSANLEISGAGTSITVSTTGVDITAPTVTGQNPGDGATTVSLTSIVIATFDEAMKATSINTLTYELRGPGNTLVPATIGYTGVTATLTPDADLLAETTYTATVKGGVGGVEDLAGNKLVLDKIWQFTTGGGGPQTCTSGAITMWPNTATPNVSADPDNGPIEVGVKFSSDVNGFICGIRFYKDALNTGTHIGNLWNAAGQNLASATFTSESTSGWQQVDFASPVAITENTTYVASYHAPVGQYSVDDSYFDGFQQVNPPLTALENSASGGNGVYVSGSGGFPTNTYQSSNYWVDVVFITSTTVDETPPTVTSKIPAANSLDIDPNTVVTSSFSEVLDAGTVSSSTFELRDPGNALVAAAVSYSGQTATLTPNNTLLPNTVYTATVKGGPNGVKDLAGNPLAVDETWSFTTGDAQVANCTISPKTTIWPSDPTPSVTSENDTAAVELGVKFISDVDGFICGIRFYKDVTNTGTHVANLWNAGGQNLATATFTAETVSGWQQVDFAQKVAITANTTYVASYHAPVGRYASDGGYFSGVQQDNPPLHALEDNASGGNGVYQYGPGGFPNNTFGSSNYWVDVVFIQ